MQSGGQLTAWQSASNQSINRTGYGAVAVSSQVYLLGGNSGGLLAADRTSGFVVDTISDLVEGTLVNINNTPGDLVTARELMGSTLGSGRIFVVGGNTSAGPTDTIESMVW